MYSFLIKKQLLYFVVLVDLTPPIQGTVNDGKNLSTDIQYSSETATVMCSWKDFMDPESGIKNYQVHVSVNNKLFTPYTIPGSLSLFEKHSFSLHHNDYVYCSLKAVNKAGLSTSKSSDGYKVDLTPPTVVYLMDTENGLKYQSNDSVLYIKWNFLDPDSGIKAYKLVVFQHVAGQRFPVWPTNTKYHSIAVKRADDTEIRKQIQMNLKNGAKYSTQVTAVNNALLSTIHESEGVIVDITPPDVMEVRINSTLTSSQMELLV